MTLCFGSRLKIKRDLPPWNFPPIRRASINSPSNLNFQSIDEKWRQRWAETAQEPGKDVKPKFFIVPMFPYPSGSLHMGHLRVYTISDVLARANRMWGRDVLHPMAWDAFGLPAENAAIERGVDPAEWTKQNIKQMKEQLQAMNGSFDWSREFATCDPKYYKHTQELFLKMYERGMAYQAESLVNYDPVDRTVLANEQVDAKGFSWRSGAKVEQRTLKQWFLKITHFQTYLYANLEYHEHGRWPDRVISMQRNWLGKPAETRINFPIAIGPQTSPADEGPKLKWTYVVAETNRADLLHGVQYLALPPRHPLVVGLARDNAELQLFLESLPSLPADSNAGFLLPHMYAGNPLARLPSAAKHVFRKLPVYVARYVPDGKEKLAMMGVPGHDARDWAFWNEHRPGEKIFKVITPEGLVGSSEQSQIDESQPVVQPGTLNSLCGNFAGMSSSEAAVQIALRLQRGTMRRNTKLATLQKKWKIRDWLISRQRYWGTPIPVIHCRKCGPLPVPSENLPVELPKLKSDWLKGNSGSALHNAHDWVNVVCHKCGGPAKRETDTMDTFMDSSWYFMRYIDPANDSQPFSSRAANEWLPVDIYVGGVEHSILHLLYARFICKVFATNGLWSSGGGKEAEPFKKLITQGMVHGKTFSDPNSGRFLKPEEIDLSNLLEPKMASSGEVAKVSWEKMSKSKHNGVDPMKCIKKYGADVTRAHILFQAPVPEVLEWDEEKIVGIQRWFGRIWRLTEDVERQLTKEAQLEILGKPTLDRQRGHEDTRKPYYRAIATLGSLTDQEIHAQTEVQKTITSVRSSLDTTFTLNTVVSDLMQLTNTLISTANAVGPLLQFNNLSVLLRMLAPIAPAFAEECWEKLQVQITKIYQRESSDSPSSPAAISGSSSSSSIFNAPFPTSDYSYDWAQRSRQVCIVQENGKKRLVLQIPTVPADLLALKDEKGEEKESKKKELQKWMMKQIQDTEAGKAWLAKAKEEGKTWHRIFVANGGKLVNLVPKFEGVKVFDSRDRFQDDVGVDVDVDVDVAVVVRKEPGR